MKEVIQKLEAINWDFSDYKSSRYPLDLNSIPWYPATFVPPIPKILIASLTKPDDVVLDPFGGKGTTAIETIKLNRRPVYNDYNPFACDVVKGLFAAIHYTARGEAGIDPAKEKEMLKKRIKSIVFDDFFRDGEVNPDVLSWYEAETLRELLSIYTLICESENEKERLIRQLAFSSILKAASSQPGHFTYVTDNCKPSELIYKKAFDLYCGKINQITNASKDLRMQFSLKYPELEADRRLIQLSDAANVNNGDARNLSWIGDESIDFVITSPPYLCAQDYMKTMRLTNLFFQNNEAFESGSKKEIGPRCRRRGNSKKVVSSFYDDLDIVFSDIRRILKPGCCFCLIMGQGKAKIASEYDIVGDIMKRLEEQYDFTLIFSRQRKIGNREIPVGGVDTEKILVYKRH